MSDVERIRRDHEQTRQAGAMRGVEMSLWWDDIDVLLREIDRLRDGDLAKRDELGTLDPEIECVWTGVDALLSRVEQLELQQFDAGFHYVLGEKMGDVYHARLLRWVTELQAIVRDLAAWDPLEDVGVDVAADVFWNTPDDRPPVPLRRAWEWAEQHPTNEGSTP